MHWMIILFPQWFNSTSSQQIHPIIYLFTSLHAAASEPKFQSIYLIVIRFFKMLNVGSDTWYMYTCKYIYIYFYWFTEEDFMWETFIEVGQLIQIFSLIISDFSKRTFYSAVLHCDLTLVPHHIFSPWLSVSWGITQPVSSHRLFPRVKLSYSIHAASLLVLG